MSTARGHLAKIIPLVPILSNLVIGLHGVRRPQRLIAMGTILEILSIKPHSTSRRQGLRKLSPDLIGKARDETATQITRIGLTFVGTSAFCLLSLPSPDSALLGGSERINVPFAGPVSFQGFMLLGPAVLIVLRVYLQIYVEHSERLDRLAQSMSIVRAPTLVPLQNPLIRYFSGLIFYLLLPLTMLLFAWKAAVFPVLGSGLLGVTAAVVASHLVLPLKRFSWRSKALPSAGAAIVVLAMIDGFGPVRRPFALNRANLSGHWLANEDLSRASLTSANLSGADLSIARLTGAYLNSATLTGANLTGANLSGAHLIVANLTGANLRGANLSDAHLSGANLSNAHLINVHLIGGNLTAADLTAADLSGADLSRANLSRAKLSGARLIGARLIGGNLSIADLSGASLFGANLSRTNLTGADLTGAKNLTQEQLDEACGDSNTKLREGLTVKPCSTNR
jgi:uncharacterized protein YjbI with pentapeptide repeats